MCKGAVLASATMTIAKGLLNLAHNLLKWNIVREKKWSCHVVLGGFCIGGGEELAEERGAGGSKV